MPPGQYVVYLCQPKMVIKKILVSRKATVKELSSLFPNEKKCFIFHGMTLHETMRLESYGINNADHIVVLPEDQKQNSFLSQEQIMWMNATKDQQDFNDRMFLTTNCSTRSEAARLKDLRLTKLELKRKSFSKLVSKIEEQTEQQLNAKSPQAVLPTSETPSNDPLPIFWTTPKPTKFQILRGSSEPDIRVSQPVSV